MIDEILQTRPENRREMFEKLERMQKLGRCSSEVEDVHIKPSIEPHLTREVCPHIAKVDQPALFSLLTVGMQPFF